MKLTRILLNRSLCLSILIMSHFSLRAEKDTTDIKSQGNFQAEIGVKMFSFPSYTLPSLGYSFNNHNISLGYLLTPKKINTNLLRSTGFNLSYNYFPNKRQNKFYLHFCFNSSLFYTEKMEKITSGKYGNQGIERLTKRYYLENSIGYGFHFSHFERSFVRVETGVGLLNMFVAHEGLDKYTEAFISSYLLIAYGIRFIK